MGFYSPDVLIGDARRHGVPVLLSRRQPQPGGVHAGGLRGSPLAVRLGLRYVHGLGEARQARIVERRGDRPFSGLQDFCRRTRLPRPVVENLDPRRSDGRAGPQNGSDAAGPAVGAGRVGLPEEGLDLEASVAPVDLPALGRVEQTLWEYELLGLTPGEHLMGAYRERLRARGVLSSGELASRRSGERVLVAGLVILRQRPPSAKGHVFLTLEDEERADQPGGAAQGVRTLPGRAAQQPVAAGRRAVAARGGSGQRTGVSGCSIV